MKRVSERDKVKYGKQKVKKICAAAKQKVAAALDLSSTVVSSSSVSEECRKCSDLDRPVELLKDKCKVGTRQEKIKLLTLAPPS